MVKRLKAALRCAMVIPGLSLAVASYAVDRFSVADSIGVATFENPISPFLVPAPEVSFSPDGAHFIAVTTRGDLSSNRRVATMWLFDTAQIRANLRDSGAVSLPHARMLLRCSSASNQAPIRLWRWSSNSRNVLFLRADDQGIDHLERASLDGGGVTTLSGVGQDVTGYDEEAGHVVYLASTSIAAGALYQAGGPSLADVVDGTGESQLSLVFPNWLKATFPAKPDALYIVIHGISAPVLSTASRIPIRLGGALFPYSAGQKLAIAQSGRLLLATQYVGQIPRSWARYRSASLPGELGSFAPDESARHGLYYPQEYVVVDLETGRRIPLIDAPIDFDALWDQPAAGAWSADESRLAVTGVFPPFRRQAMSHGGRQPSGIGPCAVAVVDMPTRRFSCPQSQATLEPSGTAFLSRKRVISLAWENGSRTLTVTYESLSAPNHPMAVRYTEDRDGKWHAHATLGRDGAAQLQVYVAQALNKPPVLMAGLPRGTPHPLLNPNPGLAELALGTAAPYRWPFAGKQQTGALVTPPDFRAARRYPLVIQADPLNFAEFLVDGPSHSAFAARALAARDIVALQVPDVGTYGSPGWAQENAANYRAAIQQLTQSGMIDPRRVGIIGWSHSGVFVMQSLENSPSVFKAASVFEGSTNSYSEFLAQVDYWGGNDAGVRYISHYVGAWPWGEGLKVWLTRSPGFHTDRICAPVLLQFSNPTAVVFQGWDDYAILRAQRKPVDLLYIRNGSHTLIKPRERLVDQEMNVDWFDYWLNGRKSSRPAMVGEYRRWDAMRKTLPACPPSDTN